MSISQKIVHIIATTLLWSVLTAQAAPLNPEPYVDIQPTGQHVVINLPQTRLFYYENGQLVKSYPVAVGKSYTRTPPGEYDVRVIYHNPTWSIPVSIQKEMQRSGKPVVKSVPPGPRNPLGPVFIRMGDPKLGLGIHGTNAPSSVPGVRSHGCVRMKSPDALAMAKLLQKGTPISVVYQTALLSTDDNGELWLTTFRDIYDRKNLDKQVLAVALKTWQEENKPIDGHKVNRALKARTGQPVCLTCSKPSAKISGELEPLPWNEPAELPITNNQL